MSPASLPLCGVWSASSTLLELGTGARGLDMVPRRGCSLPVLTAPALEDLWACDSAKSPESKYFRPWDSMRWPSAGAGLASKYEGEREWIPATGGGEDPLWRVPFRTCERDAYPFLRAAYTSESESAPGASFIVRVLDSHHGLIDLGSPSCDISRFALGT